MVGGDIFEIQSADPYPEDYNTVVEQAREELDSDYRPPLKKQVENLESYDMIYLGYPIWWGTYPMAVKTFLSENDFSGKTIAPFCTHGGSALGRSVTDLKKICPNSTVLTGLAITGTTVKNAQDKVSEWLKDIKLK
jgi:flavodoxin